MTTDCGPLLLKVLFLLKILPVYDHLYWVANLLWVATCWYPKGGCFNSGDLTVARITGNHYFLSPSFLNCRHGLGEGGRGCDLNVPIRPSHHMHDWMLTTGNCFFWNKFVTSNRHSSNESFDRFLTAMLGINQVIFDTIVTTNTPFLHLFWELKKVFSLLFFIHRIQINQVISQECSNMKWISIGLYCLFCFLGNCI